MQNEEFIQDFVEEASGHLENIEALLLKGVQACNTPDCINEIFRAVHSIKGTAGFFGLQKIVKLAHAMENVFGEMRSGKLAFSEPILDTMLTAHDIMKEMVADVLSSEEKDIRASLQAIDDILAGHEKGTSAPITEKAAESAVAAHSDCLEDARRHGQKIYAIHLDILRDLQQYEGGPLSLFSLIKSVGTLIDTSTDCGTVNSLDDVLKAADGRQNAEVRVLASSVLEKSLYAAAVKLPEDRIHEVPYSASTDSASSAALAKSEAAAQSGDEHPAHGKGAASNGKPVEHAADKADGNQRHLKLEDSIRVHVSVLNDLLNMASEMVLGRNQLLRTLEPYKKDIPGLSSILQNVDSLTSGMQEKIMQTRMQPVSNVFSKFPRIIREISKSLGKDIDLQLEGNEVEMDKSVIEALTDPLTHLVRNAADHGLESPEQREKLGKRRMGTILLRAYHKGGYVNIEVTDDGKGIDLDKIAAKAEEKKLATRAELNQMSNQDLLRIIFKPGFSTADKINDISGRGVGMDVVKTNIEKLGGNVEISTLKGKGTTIRLVLPLTLAIIQALIVESGGQKFAIPQANLKEIVRIKNGDASGQIEYLHGSEVIRLRGKLLPVVRLNDILRLGNAENLSVPKSDVVRILVLQAGAKTFGLAVDRIFSSEETLVKSVPIYLKNCQCYSGVTIMGDGKTAMILDAEGLVRLSNLSFQQAEASSQEDDLQSVAEENQNLLLFQCSGSETFGIDIGLISRVEKIAVDEIERIGAKEYIKFRKKPLRVIRPEQFLPVSRSDSTEEHCYVIIPKTTGGKIGILAKKIIDNVNVAVHLDEQNDFGKGILGTFILGNHLTLLLNLYELFELADPQHFAVRKAPEAMAGTVLLADDTPYFRRLDRSYLEQAGYHVVEAANGEQALSTARKQKLCAVVSDLEMPLLGGLQLAQEIRETEALKDLPLVAVCSIRGVQHLQDAFSSGFDDIVLKLERDSLLQALSTAIQKHSGRWNSDENSQLQTG